MIRRNDADRRGAQDLFDSRLPANCCPRRRRGCRRRKARRALGELPGVRAPVCEPVCRAGGLVLSLALVDTGDGGGGEEVVTPRARGVCRHGGGAASPQRIQAPRPRMSGPPVALCAGKLTPARLPHAQRLLPPFPHDESTSHPSAASTEPTEGTAKRTGSTLFARRRVAPNRRLRRTWLPARLTRCARQRPASRSKHSIWCQA